MKELSIEEKAIAYDEAIERAKELLEIGVKDTRDKRVVLSFFPELAESEDETIRKGLIDILESEFTVNAVLFGLPKQKYIAWLERQGEHANFRDKIQVGDRVTRNEDGVLVNLSQLKRVAKPSEKEAEQKPNLCDGCINRKGCINCENGELREAEQKPAEWSEEDEKMLNDAIGAVGAADYYSYDDKQEIENWLKSLRPQNRWKPSEGDIIILEKVIKGELEPKVFQATLQGILEQLKKL